MKVPVVLAVLIGTLVLACSTAAPTPAEPTPNIDATVEAKVAQERAVDATVQAKVSGTLSAPEAKTPSTTQAACKLTGGETVQSGWTGEDTGDNSCNSCFCTNGVLGCTKMACPAHQVSSDSNPVPTRQPTPKPKTTATWVRPTWTPVPTSKPTLRPTATPQLPATSFGDGTWTVGVDIQYGTYRSIPPKEGTCYWQAVSDFTGGMSSIIANDSGPLDDEHNDGGGPMVADIYATDAGFVSRNCGTWERVTSVMSSSMTSPFGDGWYVVGVDIAPGTWSAPGGTTWCIWKRMDSFRGQRSTSAIIERSASKTEGLYSEVPSQTVTIEPTDAGFWSQNCGGWTRH